MTISRSPSRSIRIDDSDDVAPSTRITVGDVDLLVREPREDAVAGEIVARRSADRRGKPRASAESVHGDRGIGGAAAEDLQEIRARVLMPVTGKRSTR